MRYELSLKLSQENLHEMAPISMIRPSTVHDLATRTSSGSLSSHTFTSRRPYISHEPYIIATIVTLKCLLLKVKVKKEHAWRCSFLPHLQFFEQNFQSAWFFVLNRVDILQRFVKLMILILNAINIFQTMQIMIHLMIGMKTVIRVQIFSLIYIQVVNKCF